MIDGKILQKIKADYIKGKGSQCALARKYGVSEKAVERIATKEHWRELRGKAEEKAGEVFAGKAGSQMGDQMAKEEEDFYNLVEQLVSLTALSMSKAAKADSITPSALEHYGNVIQSIHKVRGIKSKLDSEEQQARIDKLRREVEAGEKDAAGIEIVLGGAEAWAK